MTFVRNIILVLAVWMTFAGTSGAQAQEPWQPPKGPACFEQCIRDTSNRLNRFNGSAEFNSRKPLEH